VFSKLENYRSSRNRSALSTSTSFIIIVIIVVAAVGGGLYYYYYVATPTTSSTQSFNFASEAFDATHADTIDALNHLSNYNIHANVQTITDPSILTSAGAHGQVDMFVFQFATTTLGGIEQGLPLVAIGAETTSFLQDLVVSTNITTFQQLNGTTLAAFSLDGPVLFPIVFAAYGQNFSQYQITLDTIGDSSTKAQALIAGRFPGAFLDPEDAATVFKAVPGKFHVLATTATALPGIGGGLYFANKTWLNSHFQIAVDFIAAVLESARNMTSNLPAWIQSTYNANFSGKLDFSIYNSTMYLLQQADFFSPNMITFTPPLMNASDAFMFYGGLLNSTGNVNQIYNFSVLQAALNMIGTVKEPSGPFQTNTPLSIAGFSSFGSLGVLGPEDFVAIPVEIAAAE
jgi:hypothetical protein